MDIRTPQPTPYPDVNEVLQVLLTNTQAILGVHFVGMYLYGSLATGDFDPGRSDIDFVVVTDDNLSPEVVSMLESLHARLYTSGMKWATKLEGAYVPQSLIRRHFSPEPACPSINEGNFRVGPLGSDWVIQRHVIREQGVIVAGLDPKPLIDQVQPDAIKQSVRDTLAEWWSPMLAEPDSRLGGGEYQAYAVLTMCRALYTLGHGTIGSKQASGRWAQETLDERWRPLIRRALKWRQPEEIGSLHDILDFIAYTLERSRELGSPS